MRSWVVSLDSSIPIPEPLAHDFLSHPSFPTQSTNSFNRSFHSRWFLFSRYASLFSLFLRRHLHFSITQFAYCFAFNFCYSGLFFSHLFLKNVLVWLSKDRSIMTHILSWRVDCYVGKSLFPTPLSLFFFFF